MQNMANAQNGALRGLPPGSDRGGYFVQVLSYGANRGASHARNVGLNYSTADWVLFLDDDVLPEPHLLDAYAGAVIRHPNAKVCPQSRPSDCMASARRCRMILITHHNCDRKLHSSCPFLPSADSSYHISDCSSKGGSVKPIYTYFRPVLFPYVLTKTELWLLCAVALIAGVCWFDRASAPVQLLDRGSWSFQHHVFLWRGQASRAPALGGHCQPADLRRATPRQGAVQGCLPKDRRWRRPGLCLPAQGILQGRDRGCCCSARCQGHSPMVEWWPVMLPADNGMGVGRLPLHSGVAIQDVFNSTKLGRVYPSPGSLAAGISGIQRHEHDLELLHLLRCHDCHGRAHGEGIHAVDDIKPSYSDVIRHYCISMPWYDSARPHIFVGRDCCVGSGSRTPVGSPPPRTHVLFLPALRLVRWPGQKHEAALRL